ncbi:hypothetical protein [Desulfitobacterium sp.]|uniref:hypothetical protein n=1 Tax=Desulfitobacterium sp. TaxID=49981 RepID=UPI002C799414|nr:hypothetical protein [Desulfitobacterium sp.]HVJ50662.1 hypothetical protein [Desulfitobacterium sp.]
MRKKLLVAGVITGLCFVTFITSSYQYSYADQKKYVEDYTKIAGNYVKNNPELLSKSIGAIENKAINNDDVVTNVGSLPISISEIKFRQGLRQVTGIGDSSTKSIFNTLVEEKLIFNYAIKNNLLPTQNEINNFIELEKSVYSKEEKAKKAIDAFCLASGMSLDDYWNSYEYYNAFRAVTFKKAYDNAIEVGIKKGELKSLENGNPKNPEISKEHENYWMNIKKDMKNKTSLTINKQHLNNDFTLDNSKLYL